MGILWAHTAAIGCIVLGLLTCELRIIIMCKALWYGSQVITYLSRNAASYNAKQFYTESLQLQVMHTYQVVFRFSVSTIESLQVQVMHHT